MSAIDLEAFRELGHRLASRDRERHEIQMRRNLGGAGGRAMLTFWRELGARIEHEDELSNVEVLLRELRSDVDLMRALEQTLSLRAQDSEVATQLAQVARLVQELIRIEETVARWHRHLRDLALQWYLTLNPAIPSKARQKREAEKNQKKGKGKAKARPKEVVEPAPKTQKPAATPKAPPPKKKQG